MTFNENVTEPARLMVSGGVGNIIVPVMTYLKTTLYGIHEDKFERAGLVEITLHSLGTVTLRVHQADEGVAECLEEWNSTQQAFRQALLNQEYEGRNLRQVLAGYLKVRWSQQAESPCHSFMTSLASFSSRTVVFLQRLRSLLLLEGR